MNNFSRNYYLKKGPYLLMISFVVVLMVTCKEPRKIVVQTGTVSEVSSTSISITGSVEDLGEGIDHHGHCWALYPEVPTSNQTFKTDIGKKESTGSFSSEVDNLIPGTEYHILAYAQNESDLQYGSLIRVWTDHALPPEAKFTADRTSIMEDETVSFTDESINSPTSWSWSFGDGGTSTVQHPSHTYTSSGIYPVSLTVTNSSGSDTETKTDYITVKVVILPPDPAFTADLTDIWEDESVSFTDQSGNNPTSWVWDFGDGGTGIDQHPTYRYTTPGVFTVSLAVTNSSGSDTLTKTNYITVNEIIWPPEAAFTADKTSIYENESVIFTDESINNPTSWSWSFGDGETSPDQHPSHTYTSSGIYPVSLTVTNSAGSDTETKTDYITVIDPIPPPDADFIADETNIREGESVSFTDQSTNSPTSWSWSFGDGGTAIDQHPNHTYTTPGVYPVSLTATNASGSDTETKTDFITVREVVVDDDGNIYEVVTIGGQTWMAKNLNVGVRIDGSQEPMDNQIIEKHCYDDNNYNCDVYGGFYSWHEMMQYSTVEMTQGVCPDGWHIPSDQEWKTLEMALGMSSSDADGTDWRGTNQGGQLKSVEALWQEPNTGATNSSNFGALPSGNITIDNEYVGIAYFADWYTSTMNSAQTGVWYRYLAADSEQVYRTVGMFEWGTAIRCIKD